MLKMGTDGVINNNSEDSGIHYVLLEDCKTGLLLGQKEVGENYIEEGKEYLRNKIEDVKSYKFVVLHYTDEDYHTRILARKITIVDGMECEEVLYRASIYKVSKSTKKNKKNRTCGLGSLFRFFCFKTHKTVDDETNELFLPVIDHPNSSNIYMGSGKYI